MDSIICNIFCEKNRGRGYGGTDPSGGRGFSGASGRSAPLPARPRAGARLSLEESRRKEHQGGRGSSSLDPPFLVGRTLRGSSLFFCLACGPVSYARNGPPPGWAGWGRWFRRREGAFPPKAFPSGGRCPSAHTGADEGAILYPTFPCRKSERLSPVAPTEFFSCPVGQLGRPLISHLR